MARRFEEVYPMTSSLTIDNGPSWLDSGGDYIVEYFFQVIKEKNINTY